MNPLALRRTCALAAALVAAATLHAEPPGRIAAALASHAAGLRARLPAFSRDAEMAAGRLAGGGALYAAGQPAFVSEAHARAGGLMMLQPLKDASPLGEKDVLLAGAWTPGDPAALAACRRARQAGAHVVLFSPACAPGGEGLASLASFHAVSAAAEDDRPPAALLAAATLWVYTGELIGALSRQGRAPVVYQSVLVPGGRERNARYLSKDAPDRRRFHDDLTIEPQPPGRLGGLYLDALERQTGALEPDGARAAAGLLAAAIRAGGRVHVQTVSHFTEYEVRSDAVPAWARGAAGRLKPGPLAAAMKPGDVYLEMGYYSLQPDFLNAARGAGARTIVALCHAPHLDPAEPRPDLLLDAQWPYGDGAVALPGYDVPILPVSGVMQTLLFWNLIEETQARLAPAAPQP